jgi:hypothetical protein
MIVTVPTDKSISSVVIPKASLTRQPKRERSLISKRSRGVFAASSSFAVSDISRYSLIVPLYPVNTAVNVLMGREWN